jgi:hypothetical protein
MSKQRILSHLETLTKKLSPKILRKRISNPDFDFLKFIIEICLNINSKNLKLDKKSYQAIKKFKKHQKALISDRLTLPQKSIVAQRGGFLPLLLASAAPYIIELLVSKLMK